MLIVLANRLTGVGARYQIVADVGGLANQMAIESFFGALIMINVQLNGRPTWAGGLLYKKLDRPG